MSRGAWLAAAALVTAGPASAQVAVNRANQYLFVSDARDARAVWVNPAGLAVARDASVYAEVLARDPGADGTLGQISAGFNSRGFSVGYQYDNFDGDVTGHTWRVAMGNAAGPLALGGVVVFYQGDDASDIGWDVGLAYNWPRVAVATNFANIGQPEVRGAKLAFAVVPGITVSPLTQLALSAQGRLEDEITGYQFGAAWSWTMPFPGGLLVRFDTDNEFRRQSFAFGLSIGARDRAGLVASTPGDASGLDGLSLSGVASRPLGQRRR